MLAERADRVTLKLLNKSACALFTRRCTKIIVSGVAGGYCAIPEIPPWLCVPRLRSVSLVSRRGRNFHLTMHSAHRVLATVSARAAHPICLRMHVCTNVHGYDYRHLLRGICYKFPDRFHTVHFYDFAAMVYYLYEGPADLSGVTIYVHDDNPCGFIYGSRKERGPKAVRVITQPQHVTASMAALLEIFNADTLFVGNAATPYEPPPCEPPLEADLDCR